MKVLILSILLASQAPGGSWEAAPLDDEDDVSTPTPRATPRSDGAGELPVLTWQREHELESSFRQGLVRLYLDLLGDPNDYGLRYRTAIPQDVGDWGWHRNGVKTRLWSMRSEVDKQMKSRSGMPEETLRRMVAMKQDFRPGDLRLLMHKMPRVEDAVVTIERIQPLGGTNFRIDYVVEMRLNTFSRTTRFQAIDASYDGKGLKLPMRVLTDLSLRNERDIFGQQAPASVSIPRGPDVTAGGGGGGGGFLSSLFSGSILLDLFN